MRAMRSDCVGRQAQLIGPGTMPSALMRAWFRPEICITAS